jgi:hypothetical protein
MDYLVGSVDRPSINGKAILFERLTPTVFCRKDEREELRIVNVELRRAMEELRIVNVEVRRAGRIENCEC